MCKRKPNCGVSEKLAELQEYVESFLRDVTLDEFIKNGGPKQEAATKNLKGRKNGPQKRKGKRITSVSG